MPLISIDIKTGAIQKNKPLIVGIDLGTTNSLVAHMKNGSPVCIRNEDGRSALVPSVVHFSKNGSVEVGESAKEKLLAEPHRTIFSAKRLMGKSYGDLSGHAVFFGYRIVDDDRDSLVKVEVNGRFFTPIELSAEILKALKTKAETALGAPVEKAVITVPAYFNDAQRQATRDAGKLAGLDVLRIVNEPTAASLAYGFGAQTDAATETIAVYDLGGGTFDISILRIEAGVFEVLSTNGDTFLGGDDFDRAIVEHWLREKKIAACALLENPNFAQAIRLAAERAKRQLSENQSVAQEIGGLTYLLARPEFERIIEPFIEKTLVCCRSALKDAGLSTEQIDKIVMVGGSTRVPLVKERVARFFGKNVFDSIDPDEVVALGAAVQADILAGNQSDLLLLDVTPLSLGIETVGGLMDVIVPRNSKIPIRAGRHYTTSVDGQKNLKIAIFQGERDLVQHNRKLGEATLKGIPPMPAGLPKIEIQFSLNSDGILSVKSKELRSGVETSIEIQPSYGISEEEMAQMLLDSIQNAPSDLAQRGLMEARNEANHLLSSAEKFLSQNEALLSLAETSETRRLAEALKTSVGFDDRDAINRAISALNDYTAPLAHRAMDKTISEAMTGKKII